MHLEVWQWAFASVAVGGVLYLVSALFIPESPRYLMSRGRINEARAVLTRTLGPVSADERIVAIAASFRNARRPRFSDVLNSRRTNIKRIVWVGIGLAALQQLVGINAIFYYSTTIWATLGFGEQQALQQTLILTAVKVVAIICGILLVDRVGRRPLLLTGSILMSAALVVTAFIMLTAPRGASGNPDLHDSKGLAVLALVAMCAYVFAYAGTWGPIMWVLVGEMFPNQIRGAATSIAGSAEWTANYAVTLTFPVLAAWSIGTTYAMYAVFALISIPFVLRLVPETKGRELEEMDALEAQPPQTSTPALTPVN
ncbi:sugar porter family MFS transporter [Pengzhenrongella phosphoraccumulans]|uniref:sugar porter family MFS transporter n=1 Tax=Pengzhenrongella phosphoraccumulans TaxID=3114394 RepID=UPI00388DCAEE